MIGIGNEVMSPEQIRVFRPNINEYNALVKFMFSRKATKIDKIDSEDFVNFHGLLRKYELYIEDVTLKKVYEQSGTYHNSCFLGFFVQKVFETNLNFRYQ